MNKINIVPIGVDIGGSIIKIIYFGPNNCKKLPDYVISDISLDGDYNNLSIAHDTNNHMIHFIKIPISKIEKFAQFINNLKAFHNVDYLINITGGGAYKWEAMIMDKLNFKINKCDEIRTLVLGLNYALRHFDEEVFSFGWKDKVLKIEGNKPIEEYFPYLLVNIGSGVSIIKVEGPNKFHRVSGSSLGGGAFWGLTRLLTGIKNFEDVEKLSDAGNNKKLDLLVGDIYGSSYEKVGLPSYVIASNFGKIGTINNDNSNNFNNADIIKSLLYMFSDNITQIAYFCAKEDPNIKHVFFSGSFMRVGPVLWKKLSFGIEFWSNERLRAKFLKHEGYFGAIGASLFNR